MKKNGLLRICHQEGKVEAGCDEAGRGCLAGPVFAAAVILPPDYFHPLLNDSKQVPEDVRQELRLHIQQHAIAYSIAQVDHEEIDRINILNASFLAMHKALDKLKKRPKLLLIDGNRFTKYRRTRHECIIKGDGIYASIAAASILAKTCRDEYMKNLHVDYPQYKWITNKGYGTAEHREAIATHGPSPFHRRSFNWGIEVIPGPESLPYEDSIVTGTVNYSGWNHASDPTIDHHVNQI